MTAPRPGVSAPATGANAVVVDAADPSRRSDVLFRVRRTEDHELSPWWMVGAFVAVSGAVILVMNLVPGGA